MDTELRFQRLEKDLENARHMISCLSGAIESLSKIDKTGDEISHKNILEFLQRQEKRDEALKVRDEELHQKIDNILVKVERKITEDKIDLKQIKKLIDTVETTEGYVELFVKDFEGIHERLGDIDGNLRYVVQNSQNVTASIYEIKTLQGEQNVKLEGITNKLAELEEANRKTSQTIETLTADFVTFKQDADENFEKLLKSAENEEEIAFKCFDCGTVLVNDIESDGITQCRNADCALWNIVGELINGNMWVYIECGHYQQIPVQEEKIVRCEICGKEEMFQDASGDVAVPIEPNDVD